MNYATIKPCDVANGPGVRVSLFVSGCTHRCKGCFNPEAWDFAYGTPFGAAQTAEILQLLAPDYIRGFSLLGGEPFEAANQPAVLALLQEIRHTYPQKSIWAYSGYTFEQLCAGALPLLKLCDVLVDGPFIQEQKNLRLRFRGSENQRILDIPLSLAAGAPVNWNEEEMQ